MVVPSSIVRSSASNLDYGRIGYSGEPHNLNSEETLDIFMEEVLVLDMFT
jgi:hypothetical protein